MRTQISTGCSERTRQQADDLINKNGYSLRDVVTVAIDRMYREEFKMIQLRCKAGQDIYSRVTEAIGDGQLPPTAQIGQHDTTPKPDNAIGTVTVRKNEAFWIVDVSHVAD